MMSKGVEHSKHVGAQPETGRPAVSAITPADQRRWRLGAFQRQVERALAVVRAGLAQARRPYVAFSGGKDSLVVLDLVRALCPEVRVVWGDEELVPEETVALMARLQATAGVNFTPITSEAVHDGWFRSWHQPPFWREPLPGTVATEQRIGTELMPSLGYDAVFLGVRAAESARRRTALRAHGWIEPTAAGLKISPIAWWSVDDVWAYIAGRGLAYNAVYDRLTAIGVERPQQRVGPLPLSPGWILRAGWPQVYQRLVARYGPRW